ncbi:DUF2336 domain-containing protein [Algihabitans albus]|uniref:DUF2336 domain-containing protein n=1 Tax=Algihabitans albus TaxID=2164067 RepID=UPI000E5CBB27|nr:DUF2336 domain-containing protein [Algihabitans albus]
MSKDVVAFDGDRPRKPQMLTQADVKRLLEDPAPETRAQTVAKIADNYTDSTLGPGERRLAQEIFAVLVRDTAVIVREAMAEHLKHAPDLPDGIAVTLAHDVDSVALPILRHSEALSDAELLRLVQEAAPRRLNAIARRNQVSAEVCEAVIDTGQSEAVAHLVGNEGAEITEADLGRVLRDFAEEPAVGDQLARRRHVPPLIAEQLVARMSAQLRDVLTTRGELDSNSVSDLVLQVRDRAVLQIADKSREGGDLDSLISGLAQRGRLNASLILRALCVGDLAFFEAAMAKLANVPLANARILIYDEGKLGLTSLYRRAGLSEDKLPVFRAAVQVVQETDYDGGTNDRARFSTRLLERLLTQFDQDGTWPGDDLYYLIDRLTRAAA